MRPTIGDEKPKVVRRVCSEQTANLVKSALKTTVLSDGTAPVAGVDGMTAGGMAGRVQAINLKDGSYLPDQYWTMFAGFFPVDDPRYVVVVAVDRANLTPGKNTGRLVAAPIFRKVASKISAIGSPYR
jgi:cell division protein FtsI/penicillin-binding protein 2